MQVRATAALEVRRGAARSLPRRDRTAQFTWAIRPSAAPGGTQPAPAMGAMAQLQPRRRWGRVLTRGIPMKLTLRPPEAAAAPRTARGKWEGAGLPVRLPRAASTPWAQIIPERAMELAQ